jgi:hypothetical protein
MIPEGEVAFIIDKLHFPQYKTANWNLAKLQPTNAATIQTFPGIYG